MSIDSFRLRKGLRYGDHQFSSGAHMTSELSYDVRLGVLGGTTLTRADVFVGVAANPATVTLPVNMSDGKYLCVFDQLGGAHAGNITVAAGAGDTVDNAASIAITSDGGAVGLLFRAANNDWVIVSGRESTSAATACIEFDDGTAAAPCITFAADTNTGVYRPGPDQLAVTAAGVEVGYFTTGTLRMVDGVAATPAYAFSGDTNTGFYRVGVDSIGASCGGAPTMVWNGSGQSLITAGTAGTPSLSIQGDTDTGLFQVAANQLGVSLGGTEQARFTNSGDLRLSFGFGRFVRDVTSVAVVETGATGITYTAGSFYNGAVISRQGALLALAQDTMPTAAAFTAAHSGTQDGDTWEFWVRNDTTNGNAGGGGTSEDVPYPIHLRADNTGSGTQGDNSGQSYIIGPHETRKFIITFTGGGAAYTLSCGSGPCSSATNISRYTDVQFDATVGALTYTIAMLHKGIINRDPAGASRVDVLPTAALAVAGFHAPNVGQTVEFSIINNADAAETIEVTAGVGGARVPAVAAHFTIAQNTSARFALRLTNVGLGTEAYVVYRLS